MRTVVNQNGKNIGTTLVWFVSDVVAKNIIGNLTKNVTNVKSAVIVRVCDPILTCMAVNYRSSIGSLPCICILRPKRVFRHWSFEDSSDTAITTQFGRCYTSCAWQWGNRTGNICQLNHSIFYKMKLGRTAFIDSQLQDAYLTEAELKGIALQNCELMNAIFENTNLGKDDLTK